MSSSSKRTISFSLPEEIHKQEFEEIAKMCGYSNIAALARVALFQHIRRYKLAERLAVQRKKAGGKIPAIIDILGD